MQNSNYRYDPAIDELLTHQISGETAAFINQMLESLKTWTVQELRTSETDMDRLYLKAYADVLVQLKGKIKQFKHKQKTKIKKERIDA